MKKNKSIIILIILIIVCVGVSILLKNKPTNKEINQKTNSNVDAKLEDIKKQSKNKESEEKTPITFCIYPLQKEIIGENILEKIKNLASATEEENDISILYTDYASQRNTIKKYIKEEIDNAVSRLKEKNISVSYDLTKGTITISELEDCSTDSISENDVKVLCGLIGMYSNVGIEDGSKWMVLLYHYDKLGEMSTLVYSEDMISVEEQYNQINELASGTDALTEIDTSDIVIELEGD